jgi:hypothetical protein
VMNLRELRRQCERFTLRLVAEGANPEELAGLLIGAHMRFLRDRGVTREWYMEACALLWDKNNAPDTPVDVEDV